MRDARGRFTKINPMWGETLKVEWPQERFNWLPWLVLLIGLGAFGYILGRYF